MNIFDILGNLIYIASYVRNGGMETEGFQLSVSNPFTLNTK